MVNYFGEGEFTEGLKRIDEENKDTVVDIITKCISGARKRLTDNIESELKKVFDLDGATQDEIHLLNHCYDLAEVMSRQNFDECDGNCEGCNCPSK